MAAAVLFSACGPELEAFKPTGGGATPVSVIDKGDINGKPARLYIAKSYSDRARAQLTLRFAKNKDDKTEGVVDAVAMVYGGDEKELVLTPYFNSAADIVFINKSGEAVHVLSGDMGYVPIASGDNGGPNFYRSDKPASIALFLRKGGAADYGIPAPTGSTSPASISISNGALKAVADASPAGTGLSFIKHIKDDKLADTELPKPIEVPVRVALTAEERASGLGENENNALLLLYPESDKDWLRDGFWLKGMKGKYSIAFMRLQSGWQSGTLPMTGAVLDIIEGIEDGGTNDLDRPRWWPSKTTFERPGNSSSASTNGAPNSVLIVRGEKAISSAGIDDEMLVVTDGPIVARTSGGMGNVVGDASLVNQWIGVGAGRMALSVARGQAAIDAAATGLIRSAANEVTLLVWDDASQAKLNNSGAYSVQVGLLEPTAATNTLKIAEVVDAPSGKETAFSGARSRFAVISRAERTVNAGSDVVLPGHIAQLKPTLARAAFYRAAKPEQHPVTTPANAKATVNLEIAETPTAIMRGLMGRTSLPANQGMLFIFKEESEHKFWMKNCLMDIDVAFVDEDLEIVTIKEMKKPAPGTPEDELELYSSRLRVKYAVEMEGGWFAKNNIKTGDRLWIPAGFLEPKAD